MEKRVGVAEVIVIAFLGHLYSLCIVPGVLAVPGYPPGWLYIDCGATASWDDNYTGVTWLPDAAYISTGVNYASVSRAPTTLLQNYPELSTLRFFNDSQAKNCYSLPVTPNQTYILRATFLYDASYDNALRPPRFSMAIDGTVVANISVNTTGLDFDKPEFTVKSQNKIIFLCLTQNASLSEYGNPFISGISLRPGVEYPLFSDLLNAVHFIKTRHRLNFGGNTTQRNPTDSYDRWWSNEGLNTSYLLCTAPIQELTTNQTIKLWSYNAQYVAPQVLFQTALTTNGNMTIRFLNDGPQDISAYLILYFAELDPKAIVGSRGFSIHVPGYTVDFYIDIYSLAVGTFSAVYYIQPSYNGFFFQVSSTINLYPNQTSQLGPLVSAMELYEITAPSAIKTLDRDGLAIDAIKSNTSSLSIWTGDPCLPSPHPWVTCGMLDSTVHPVIVAVNLSGYRIGGTISSSFAHLSDLTSLLLDNNSFIGLMPDLSVLTKLRILHLQDNMLSGTIPDWLATLTHLTELFMENNNFSGDIPKNLLARTEINFRYSPGNTLLRNITLKPPPHPPSYLIDIILGCLASVGVLGMVVEAMYLVTFYRMRCQQPGLLRKGTREWRLQDVQNITNNFDERTNLIDVSPFENVFEGILMPVNTTRGSTEEINTNGNQKHVLGTKFIVRRQTVNDPVHNQKLLNEVNISSRVHHKNLVSLTGHCREEDGMLVLIHEEFFQNRSLKDYLKEENPKLKWLTQLQIALNVSQGEDLAGLNYLHTDCTPPIIHCDVRSANILVIDLLSEGETTNITAKDLAKVTNFGLSREMTEGNVNCNQDVDGGDTAYLDPVRARNEYRWFIESDVFGFGLVLLELITSRGQHLYETQVTITGSGHFTKTCIGLLKLPNHQLKA